VRPVAAEVLPAPGRQVDQRHVNTVAVIAQAQDSFRFAIGIVSLTLFFGAVCLLLSTAPRGRKDQSELHTALRGRPRSASSRTE